jgi:hypothetical protein
VSSLWQQEGVCPGSKCHFYRIVTCDKITVFGNQRLWDQQHAYTIFTLPLFNNTYYVVCAVVAICTEVLCQSSVLWKRHRKDIIFRGTLKCMDLCTIDFTTKLNDELILYITVVVMCTRDFNFQNFYIFLTKFIYGFHMILRINYIIQNSSSLRL